VTRTFRLKGACLSALAPLIGASVIIGALAGCSWFAKEETPACPRAAILAQARAVPVYRDGPGRDPTDITYEVGIGSLKGECSYDTDEGRTTITSVLSIGIEAKRGPAGESDRVEVPYFVAVVDPARNILAKQVFRPELVFEKSGIRTGTVEEIEQDIPISAEFAGQDYQIYIGLQIGRDQLAEQLKRPQ